MGCHLLLQGLFPTQGSNLGLLPCRKILYWLSHSGSLEYIYLKNNVSLVDNYNFLFFILFGGTKLFMYALSVYSMINGWLQFIIIESVSPFVNKSLAWHRICVNTELINTTLYRCLSFADFNNYYWNWYLLNLVFYLTLNHLSNHSKSLKKLAGLWGGLSDIWTLVYNSR